MLSKKRKILRVIVIGMVFLVCFNTVSWTLPEFNLAAMSRLRPFFERHGLDFRSIATVMYAAGKLNDLVTTNVLRESQIVRLNSEFQNSGIEIESTIKKGVLQCTGKEYNYVVFHIKEEKKTIDVLFIKDHHELTSDEIRELRINDAEIDYLDCPSLVGVWFRKSTVLPLAATAPILINRVKEAVRNFRLRRCISNASMVIYLLRAFGEKAVLMGMYNIAEDMPFQYLVKTERWGEIDITPPSGEHDIYEETREAPEADYERGVAYLRDRGHLALADKMLAEGYFQFPDGERIHRENLKHAQIIPDKIIVCHIVANSILPYQQKDMLNRLESEMRKRDDYSEKIVSLSVNNPYDPEEFMKKLEMIKLREEKRYEEKGYKVQFDVACPNTDLVGRIQKKYKLKIQALAFAKEMGGDIVQVEGIMLALRVLRTGNIDNLCRVYNLLTGKELVTNKIDSNELARDILFVLPSIEVKSKIIGELNRIIEENIKNAA